MKIEKKHIKYIQISFSEMQSVTDFLDLLNYVKRLIYDENYKNFNLKQINYYTHPKNKNKAYTKFQIKKKSGATRTIYAPENGLKAIQKIIALILQCLYKPHEAARGFVIGKSIVDNAKEHEGKNYVYNIDLKDFFPSINQERIWACLKLSPFNLNNNTTLINTIAALSCAEMQVERKDQKGNWVKVKKSVLPQGAPTSPVFSNIICQKLDNRLTGVAKRFNINYTRYADDITFSSMHSVYQENGEFLKELSRVIKGQNFHIKESKTRLQKTGYRQEVTGLVVNDSVNVRKRYIKQIRMWLYYWEKYGYNKAEKIFLIDYSKDKGNIKSEKPNFQNVLSGKLEYLKMVKGVDNGTYLSLNHRFERLRNSTKEDIKIFEKWEQNGINPDIEMNKLNFILELWKTVTPNSEQEEKLLSLVSNELKFSLQEKKQFIEDIHLFKKLDPNPKKKSIDLIDGKKAENVLVINTFPIIHKPKRLVTLLKNFSKNSSALKYTTHSWDAGRDRGLFKNINTFLLKSEKEYKKFSFELSGLNSNLNAKIYSFLFKKDIELKGWGINRIKFGWSAPKIQKDCESNLKLNPEDVILPEKSQMVISGKLIQKFKHVIEIFKDEIEIRDENSGLLNLILEKHDTYLIDFKNPKIENLENKTFYTDVQWLGKALDLIFKNIQSRSDFPEMSYKVREKKRGVFNLEILQYNSFNKGMSIYNEKLKLDRGSIGEISNYLKNLCDWSIESTFKEGKFRINYLTSDNAAEAFEPISECKGFKHILTFYS